MEEIKIDATYKQAEYYNNGTSVQESVKDFLENVKIKTEYTLPDLQKLKTERQKRNADFLLSIKLCDNSVNETDRDNILELNVAAITIQKIVRGFLGRRRYLDVLYEAVLASENDLHQQEQRQKLEGEILVESYRIEREIEDNENVTRNRTRFQHDSATKIQRAWREHYHDSSSKNTNKEHHVCCSCVDNFPDLYDYYTGNDAICFCCDQHRLLSNSERLELLLYDDTIVQEGLDNDIESFGSEQFNENCVDIFNNNDKMKTESNSVLKSIEILRENKSGKGKSEKTKLDLNLPITKVHSMSLPELRLCVKQLENAVAEKNLELLKELMIRDELFSKSEALKFEADDLSHRKINVHWKK